jgi:uncharacterized membrane protein
MQRSFFTALASVWAIASSLCAPGVGYAQTNYTLTQVGPNDGIASTTVTGINDEGDLALTVESGPTVSTYLGRRGTQTNIGGLIPAPQFVESGGVNDLLQIVGTTISPTSGNFCAFIWSQGHMSELPSPAGSPAAFGIQVNLLGQVVGQVFDANFNAQAALWSHGTLTLLPGIAGGNNSQPVGINIRGEIVGFSSDISNVNNTVVWRQGTLTVLINNAIPSAINDLGQIVGTLSVSGTPGTPFLWQNGATTQLPTLPGMAPTGTAEAINDRGQIVGSATNVAVLWQNGAVVDLNNQIAATDPLQPYVHLQAGSRINNLGLIVAIGTDSRNPAIGQWYLLTPAN